MNNEERDALLIRLDERTAAQHEWNEKHEQLHAEQRSTQTKWLLANFTLIGGILTKLIFWR